MTFNTETLYWDSKCPLLQIFWPSELEWCLPFFKFIYLLCDNMFITTKECIEIIEIEKQYIKNTEISNMSSWNK